ncbi:hypothetical protein SAMN05444266_107302 [Chitinophaga jiangningensis]|uniref:Uncharacterized protein n=1 Tax=Chitinophaga jiangningensis TaxID=1419482 RepID=A0A1M7HMU3_9BACT|nr:hypothetical protein SAMN05444266_107302 [Chitinophaga jiangningensis]
MVLKTYLPAVVLLSAVAFFACKKKNKGTDTPPVVQEEALKFSLSGVEEGAYNQALDSSFTFKVKVDSKMPEKGVITSLNVVSDPAGIGQDQDAVANSTSATYDVTLKHLKELKTYKVTINLTSAGNSGNVATPKIFYITNKKPL